MFRSGDARLSKRRSNHRRVTATLTDIVGQYHLTCDVEDIQMMYQFDHSDSLQIGNCRHRVQPMWFEDDRAGHAKESARAIGFADMRPKIDPRHEASSYGS